MKNYRYLIFDADHTLIDYAADEKAAFARLFCFYGVSADERMLERAHALSEKTWTEEGLYAVHEARIQREYHALYRSHLTLLFERIFGEYEIAASPQEAGKLFLKELEAPAHLIEGAEETLRALQEKYALAVATNGLEAIQAGRLTNIAGYFQKTFVSETLGAIKPTEAFFHRMLDGLGAKKEECLMIGDSLSSDMAGAALVGVDGCWYNPRRQKNDTPVSVAFEIERLDELVRLL